MTAKEMFKKQGYEIFDESEICIIYKNCYRTVFFSNFDKNERYVMSNGYIGIDLLKAIYKQAEEFGWV